MKDFLKLFLLSSLFLISPLCADWEPKCCFPTEDSEFTEKPEERFYELAIAAIFRDEAPYLKEWIEYHRMIGVDRFLLYNNGSEDEWEKVLHPYIDEGVVTVFDWPSKRNEYIDYQLKAYRDALNQVKGDTRWIALIDIDEFLLPMEDKSLVACLQNHFSEASAVYVSQRMFGTGGIHLSPGESQLTHLTQCALKNHEMNCSGKTIVRPEKVNIEAVVCEHCVPLYFEGRGYYNSDAGYMEYWAGKLRMCYHHDRYLRLNHYTLRDENFFQNSRLAKARKGIYGTVDQFLKIYQEYSQTEDYTILNFIQQHHPHMFKKFWELSTQSRRPFLD